MNHRLLYGAMVALAVMVVVKYAFLGDKDAPAVVGQEDSAPAAERRLDNLRKAAATIPAREDLYKKAQAELSQRETGLLKANTEQEAQVALLELVQNTGRANQVTIQGSQEFRDKVLNDDYGEVSVAVAFTCGMEQLVNLLAAIGNQPEILATNEIHISGGSDKKKNVQVRLVVSAAVPRKLLPEKKGTGL
ncbi:MAG TPA: type II secretion system protein GspM [Bryobacteraceae bacterium]|nr:type II secretion system protein GspM [Bryobacteraceae bacterium]